jgi:phage shock protein A
VKVKALHEQVASMEKIVEQMKINKEQIYNQVQQLKQRINQLINDITVSYRAKNKSSGYNRFISMFDIMAHRQLDRKIRLIQSEAICSFDNDRQKKYRKEVIDDLMIELCVFVHTW